MKIHVFIISSLIAINIFCNQKIIGLVPVRNEVETIDQVLKALSLFVDSIVVLDDASNDGTPEKIKSIASECKVEKLIEKKKWHRDEPGDANKMLQEGRRLGGTHFIRLDADEMFTANLLEGNWLRNKILELKPGDKYVMSWIQLWRSTHKYRFDSSVWSGTTGDFIFCDDGKCFYKSGFIHTTRSPQYLGGEILNFYEDKPSKNRSFFMGNRNQLFSQLEACGMTLCMLERYVSDIVGPNPSRKDIAKAVRKVKSKLETPSELNCYRNDFSTGVMHFQFVNWDCLLAKQAWYRCLEKIRNPKVDIEYVNKVYGESKNEEGLKLREAPQNWFEGYSSFYAPKAFVEKESWHKKQILSWLNQYEKSFFKDLDIWDAISF
jgi:glycosyltransferase involved in cell wall biosynthesis